MVDVDGSGTPRYIIMKAGNALLELRGRPQAVHSFLSFAYPTRFLRL